MPLIETSVDELQFGMYVSQLDRPWTETPFMFQGFLLKSDKQLDALRKYCKHVFVDSEKEDSSVAAAAVRGTTVYVEQSPLDLELPRAQGAINKAATLISSVSNAVNMGAAFETEKVVEATTEVTSSVLRNPDAANLLVQLQAKRGETFERGIHVSVMMSIFGRFLQLPRESIEHLGLLGMLQDVGKLNLPAELINKTAPHTPEEEALYRTHVDHSVRILSATPGLPPELPAHASLHHEHFDGTGYPRGLRGGGIAFPGMIAAIVDFFDTCVAPRPLGKAMSPSDALSLIYKGRGTLFQRALAEQFIQCVGVYPVGCAVELNTGEIAVVIAQNTLRLKPRVMVVRDAKGFENRPFKMLDLSKDHKASATETYMVRRTLGYDVVKIDPRELFL